MGPPESPWQSPCCESPSTSPTRSVTLVTFTSTARFVPTPDPLADVAP